MTGIWAKTILRSRNAASPDRVLSTLLVRLPTVLLAEFNTHRAFSRNAASTRAIPTERLIQQVLDDPFIPVHWGLDQKGMQAGDEHQDPEACRLFWLQARNLAVTSASNLTEMGLHKQVAGRLLAPFMWTIVCVSATEWSNFLALRDHPDAEPHMQLLAKAMRAELERTDNIQVLRPGEWHLPFVRDDDIEIVDGASEDFIRLKIALSVARCASTSYKTVDGFDMTLDRAIALHDKLVASRPIHASPCEHVAWADGVRMHGAYLMGWEHPREHRNFVGFRQYRAQIEGAA